MDPAIIAALIGAGGAIVAAIISVERGKKQKKRADREELLKKIAISALEKKQPDILDLYYEFDKYYVDIEKEGNCSVKRVVKIVPTEQSKPISDKKFILIHRGMDFYLSKTKKTLLEINPDTEFGIIVRDIKNNVRLGSSTNFAGINNEELVTNVIFDNALTKNDAGDGIEIIYSRLDVSFFWKTFWEEHIDEWIIKVDNPVKNHETQILFPEALPSWFRLTEIGTVLIPKEWTSLTKDILCKRKRLLLKASNLERGKTYRLKIDVS